MISCFDVVYEILVAWEIPVLIICDTKNTLQDFDLTTCTNVHIFVSLIVKTNDNTLHYADSVLA